MADQEVEYSIVGEGRDREDRRYIQFQAGEKLLPVMPVDLIVAEPKRLYGALANAGANLFTAPARKAVLDMLQSWTQTEPSFKVVTKIGWIDGLFVLPGVRIGKCKVPVEADLGNLDVTMRAKYRSRGSLAEWRTKIVKPCRGNTRLMLSLSLAFTGPILRFVDGPRTGGFQIFGPAEAGKTTAAMIAGSVWGCHVGDERKDKGFLETWHTTAGRVELTAMAHSETLLVLDETNRAGRNDRERAEVVKDLVFSLAEAVEKERLTNVSAARAWRCYFLSTSNRTFSDLARSGGLEVDDAHLGRMFDIPCPSGFGLYEELHSFEGGEKLTDALKARCRSVFGVAGIRFLKLLAEHSRRDKDGLKDFLDKRRKNYRRALAAAIEAERLRDLKRASSRFATVYAAGCLAIRYKILPWTKLELRDAILACHLDGLRLSESEAQLAEQLVSSLRRKLVEFIIAVQETFIDLGQRRPTREEVEPNETSGFLGCGKEAGWFYLPDRVLARVIGRGPNGTALKRELADEGLMVRPKTGFVVQRRVFSGGVGNQNYSWVNVFSPELVK